MNRFRTRPTGLPTAALAALTLGLLAQTAQADVFKWVDSQGHTHYSDKPPEASVNATPLALDRPGTPAKPADGAARTAETPAANAKAAALHNKVVGVEQPDNSPEAQRQREDNCQRMKTEYNLLSGGGRVFTLDAQGERNYVDDDTRAAREAELQQQISSSCK